MKLLAAAIAIAMVVALSACGSGGSGSIAFIGDSLTTGANASSQTNSFVSLVTSYIDERSPKEQRIYFLSYDPLKDPAVAAKAMKHDRRFVIIELGVHAVIDDAISPDQFRQLYGSILDCVTGGDTIVIAGTIPWLGWAAITPTYERADLFSQIIAQEAVKRQVAVADLWSATKLRLNLISTPQDPTFLGAGHGDNFHPNDAGHAVIAQAYEQVLAAELAHPPDRPFDRQCY